MGRGADMKKGDFTQFVEYIKKEVTEGRMTEEEAVHAVLGKTRRIFQEMAVSQEQFMKDRAFEASNIN